MLTSLELFGFKSFADRTLFEFSPGITCVVGPNGSGKSNVVDAIKWILGDQSPKSLRGKDMLDVVFNGSSGRKPSGFAEATLSFDNSNGLFPIDATEVRFGRRLYRSGDSEYLLNGAAVRLKDIKDLFLGTGAGTAAYSIIEQGRVDQILQANPTTRRVVFEEAAGISRYKSRKVDAERKLEKVAQNLLRLTDIVDEVEAQLTSTRSQASKAAKYRELSVDLKSLWIGLAADDWRVLHAEQSGLSTLETQLQTDLDSLLAEIASVESRKSALDTELAALGDQLRREEKRTAAAREQIAARESTIRHQTAREVELTIEVDRLRGERCRLIAEASAIDKDLQETTQRLAEFQERVVLQRSALTERETICGELRQELAEHEAWAGQRRSDLKELQQQMSASDRHGLKLTSQIESLETAIASIAAQLERIEEQSRLAEEELESRRAATTALESEHRVALELVATARAERQTLLDEQTQLEQTLATKRERRSVAVARIHVLDDLERRQEGVSIGVRDILRRAHDSPHPPWNQIVGCVSDLLQVALESAPLIEVALGNRSQLVVVRQRQPLIDYLNRQAAPISGRVGFLELQHRQSGDSQPTSRPLPALQGEPGIVCRADELVAEISEAAGLGRQLLQNTWITSSLDAAVDLSSRFPGVRFVTQQGELVDSDGVVYAGTVPNTTALVSRRSELRDLKHEIIRLDRDLERGGRRAQALATDLEAARDRLRVAEQQTQKEHEELAAARSEIEVHAREVERIAAEYSRVEEQHRQHLLQQTSLQQSLDQSHANRAQLQQQIDVVNEDQLAAEDRVSGVARQLSSVQDQLKEQQLELATHEERLTSLRDVLSRLHGEQEQRNARRTQSDNRLRAVLASQRQARMVILSTRSELDHAFLQVEEVGREIKALSSRHRQLRAGWSEITRQEEECHRRRRTLQDQRHHCEIRLRELNLSLTSLQERISEEYQQPLSDFVDQQASAYFARVSGSLVANAGVTDSGTDDSGTDAAEWTADTTDNWEETAENDDRGPAAPRELEEWAALYATGDPSFAEIRPELEEQVNRLRRKLKLLGSVNTDALAELDDLESRFTHLSAQLQDLQAAKSALEDIIRRINKESRRLFLETFDSIRTNFRELFRKVFGGGEGDIILEDSENVLDCGIDIVARPPGKELRSITLLSGGEKTMTAVALLFAMFKSKPSPYCILDEVDAALDEANVDRYVNIVKEFAQGTQFVVITHRKRTMTAASVLYGVTMEQAGVSKRMSVRFEDVNDDGHFRNRAEAA